MVLMAFNVAWENGVPARDTSTIDAVRLNDRLDERRVSALPGPASEFLSERSN